MSSAEARVAELENEISRLRSFHASQLREIAAAAGLREAHAVSLVASSSRKQHVECGPMSGPGSSPGDSTAGEGASPPPRGALDGPSPNAAGNKLNRWLSRSSKQGSSASQSSTPGSLASSSHPTTPAAPAPASPAPAQDPVHEVPAAAGGDAAAPSGKLGRWLARKKPSEGEQQQQQQQQPSPSSTPGQAVEAAGSGGGKLGRWLNKARESPGPTPPAQSGVCADQAAVASSWPVAAEGAASSSSSGEDDESEEHLRRIRESFAAVDSALKLFAEWQRESKGAGGGGKGPQGPLCPQCRGEVAGSCESSDQPANKASTPAQSRGMGMRVEETHRGLSVSHVVPGGPGEEAGVEVLDIIKNVNGRAVSRLKDLGATMRDASGTGSVTMDIVRGRGKKKEVVRLVAKVGDGSGSPQDGVLSTSPGEGGGRGGVLKEGADALLQTFLKARREDKGVGGGAGGGGQEPASPPAPSGSLAPSGGASSGGSKLNSKKKYNKYGKDTQLWMPACDDGEGFEGPGVGNGGAGAAGGKGGDANPKQQEAGGFFMFPPGHPDYVPLPPGEAALIAGRSDVHPNERLAPHWSHIIFKAPSGAEIRAQARHATYGTIDMVAGKLVNADPITAHTPLANAQAVAGNVVYVKRGSAPFTNKARQSVAAGALACVVANSDRETFGMSYTDDGLPFEALNIPCVMISSDIASKLEVSDAWSVTLMPARPDQQGSKKPPQNRPKLPNSFDGIAGQAADHGGVGMCEERRDAPSGGGGGDSSMTKIKSLPGLEGLPITPKPGVDYGRPGKKPTMWKKIKLLLP